jgi:hypothetical protein
VLQLEEIFDVESSKSGLGKYNEGDTFEESIRVSYHPESSNA